MYNSTERDENRGEQEIRKITKLISDHFNRLWEARNAALHSNEEDELQQIRSEEANEVRYYHSHPNLLKFDDRHYCDRPLDKILHGPKSTRRRWLRKVKKSVQAQEAQGTRQTLITSYFTTT
ncbi:hypothetical protein MHU86_1049 [Fragilaria crotonensis]|nr:hypothetical protein MHU86_1049 [Fragilaria crotonensis]